MSAESLDSFQITRDIRHFTKLLFYLDKVQANQNDFRSSSCHSMAVYYWHTELQKPKSVGVAVHYLTRN